MNLTLKQKILVEIIKEFQKEHGYSPTIREIGEITGKCPSTIFSRLLVLEKQGAIKTTAGKLRSIVVLVDD